MMKVLRTLAVLLVLGLTARVEAVEVFNQPPSAAGGQFKSAWYAPDGLDSDEYVYDDFTLAGGGAISEIRWRGGYTNELSGAGRAPVYDFTISIFRSIPAGSQPDMGTGGRLARHFVGGNAGETPAGTVGGVQMYDYAFTLPVPFQAAAATKYWVQIEASQGVTPTYGWPPDWSIARGTGGNNAHFRRVGGTGGFFTSITGDAAFSLHASGAPTVMIAASAFPAGSGSVLGAGAYPVNSTVALDAAASAGWGFVNWTQGGAQVSTNPHYTFPATADRTLIANFVPAHSVVTASSPSYAGTIVGGGVYNDGATATLIAAPNHGFVFTGWSDGGTTATHAFPVTSDVQLTAFFDSAPLAATFDFDAGPVHTSLPLAWTVDGLTALFTGAAGNYSVQPSNTWGINPSGFAGLCLLPNTVFAADLIVEFSAPIVDFSILYSPQELGCDDSARMRATAYLSGVMVGTDTATCPNPGSYPSGTLSVAVATGFDRVVVHYDARPPTCQDWGPIFFADNVTVTRLCAPPAIVVQPESTASCASGLATFGVAATGTSYQWQAEIPFDGGVFVDLADGAVAGVGVVAGAGLELLTVSDFGGASRARIRCIVSTPCGSVTSDSATLTICAADFNCAGGVSVQDIYDFLAAWNTGDTSADFNAVGGVTVQDIYDFLAAWNSGGAGCA